MKLIEALKKLKLLERKSDDIRTLVRDHAAISSIETPKYVDTRSQVKAWIQAHSDILKEILRLRIAIQETNLDTTVDIEINSKIVTKSIAEWIHRRRDLSGKELSMWQMLSDRGIKEGVSIAPSGDRQEVKVNRFYDAEERDNMKFLYSSEPTIIDSKLEVINAVTDLIE